MNEATITVDHEVGLHARPAAAFVKAAQQFESDIVVTNLSRDGVEADAKSIVQIFKAAVAQGHEIKIAADGPDAQSAVATLIELIESNFGE